MLNRFSIKTKFIIVISVLMAGVLSLQFYLTNRVHQEIISELKNFTSSFNLATDAYFFGDPDVEDRIFIDERPELSDKRVDIIREEAEVLLDDIDSFSIENYLHVRKNKEKVLDDMKWIGEKFDRLKNQRKFKIALRPDSGNVPLSVVTTVEPGRYERIVIHGLDSLAKQLKDLDLKADQLADEHIIREIRENTKANFTKQSESSFSFIIPDFSAPAKPRILEYQYSPEELNNMIRKMRNRNALITLILFGLSIVAVTFIAKQFLKPIRSLNESFDRVVQGDLTVTVDSEANDEIGDLTRSFNTMVVELKKNREKEDLLRRKERLASLGQLAAGVAHEIKNPLNAINLTIEHLQDKFVSSSDNQALSYIRTIQNEIKRLDKTVNNFLNYIRSEKLERIDTDINALLTDILQLYERELVTGGIEVKTEFREAFIMALDRERFKTAVVNIMINAVQSMSGSGVLSVTTDAGERSITITDTGCGIPKKELDHIFDLFYTTRSGGTGLGLPTAYKIIKEHQGDITISSEPGKGTVVVIRLNEPE